jgi:hypothetical protein
MTEMDCKAFLKPNFVIKHTHFIKICVREISENPVTLLRPPPLHPVECLELFELTLR